MTKTEKIFLLFLLGLFIIVLFWNIEEDTFFSERGTKEILADVIPIQSINPKDTNYADLAFLENILQGKRIVLLGEALHFDGSVFQAKTRLIQYLHDYLGYNVLVWEAGLYDICLMNRHPLPDGKMDYSLGLFEMWAKAKENQQLWDYLGQQRLKNNPVLSLGMDLQLSGNIPDLLRYSELVNYLSSRNISLTSYPVFNSIAGKLYDYSNFSHYFAYRLRDSQRDSLYVEIHDITTKLTENTKMDFQDSVYVRYLNGFALWIETVYRYEIGNPARFAIRDSIMAENFIWLSECYKDEKFIIWCSNMHLQHDHTAYASKYGNEFRFISLGERLKSRYKDTCYSIAFSWYCTQTEDGNLVQRAGNRSIESVLHKQGIRYGFIDFTHLDSGSFWHKEFSTKANHGQDISGFWSKMTDSFFFIDTSKRSTFNKE